jgi:hypothetical protein
VFLVLLLAAITVSLMVTVMIMPLAYSIAYGLIAGIGVGVLILFILSIVGIEKLVFHDPDAEEKKELLVQTLPLNKQRLMMAPKILPSKLEKKSPFPELPE